MKTTQVHANGSQKQIDPLLRPEAEPTRQPEQGTVQQVAPQAAYWRAQVNGNGLRPADVLALQRTVGNREMRRMVGRRSDDVDVQQPNALIEDMPRITMQTKPSDGTPTNPLELAARDLYNAMAGAGTNEATIHGVLGAHRGQGEKIDPFYRKTSGGESLKEALIGELEGHDLFRAITAYYGALQVEQEAELLSIAMRGPGTDDQLFWAVLTPYASRNNAQRQALMDAYDRYGNLMADIDDDFDGEDFRNAVGMLTLAPTPALTQAGQEAEARNTLDLCWDAAQWLWRQTEPILKNTAVLLLGPAGDAKGERRLLWQSMTLRHDNAELVARRGEDPRTRAYFFYGNHEDNSHGFSPDTMGTIQGNTVVVRGVSPSGRAQTPEEVANTFVHEASHILVSSYREHPQTVTSAASFDRYKDEFRAYWVATRDFPPSRYATENERARAIRTHLAGTGPRPNQGGYQDLRERYWGSADQPQSKPRDGDFVRQVDAHMRPDGFNLDLNPRLDRLFQMLNDYPIFFTYRHYSTLVDFVRTRLTAHERLVAQSSPLICKLTRSKIGNVVERLVVQHALGIAGS